MKKIIKNIFVILNRDEKVTLGKLIFFDVIVSVLDISFLFMLLYIVRFYTEAHHAKGIAFLPLDVFDRFPLLPIAVFFVLFGLKNLAGYGVLRMQFRFVYRVASRLSKDNLEDYLQGSYPDYVDIDSSIHNRRIGQEPIEFGHYILGGVQQIAGQSILVLITIIAILIFSPVLFPLLALILIPPIALAGYLIKRKLNTIRKSVKSMGEKALQHLQESLSGFVESNVYERRDFFVKRYTAVQTGFNEVLAEQLAIQNLPSRLIEAFAVFGLFILILINLYKAGTHVIQVITIGAFMAASYKIIPGIVKILNMIGQIRTYSFTVDDLVNRRAASRAAAAAADARLADEVQKTTDAAQPATNDPRPGAGIKALAFERVSFAYKQKAVLTDFSMSMASGDFIGLSGISGKGKTTLIHLLLGFLEPCSGAVTINGTVTNMLDRQRYWKGVSYVKQQPFLIHDTIVHNITMDEDAADEQRLGQALQQAGLLGLLVQSPADLFSMIAENGRNISGGQRQRIAIARALYKHSDLIILDEPFNELDEGSERTLLHHFKKLSQAGKMIILITHNKKSLSFCDSIISLDETDAGEKT